LQLGHRKGFPIRPAFEKLAGFAPTLIFPSFARTALFTIQPLPARMLKALYKQRF
jgi:hypothetical protein